MARNLQAKLPSSDTIRVFDINADSIQKFANETKALGSGAAVKIVANAREAAEDAVSLLCNLFCQCRCYSAHPHMMNLSYP
jgi:ornithine cyclodeaminase/alanine dehydrogenase-like protein (mu-crystallin family)